MGDFLELIALIWFLVCWLGYTYYSRRRAADRPCLSNTLDMYREDWMRVMLRRENRIADASVVGNLERNGAFRYPAKPGNMGIEDGGSAGGVYLRLLQIYLVHADV